MADGIEFLLELDAKLEGARRFADALNRVDQVVDKADRSLKKAESKVSLFGRAFQTTASKASQSWSQFTGRLGAFAAWDAVKLGFRAVQAGVGVITDLGSQLLHAAAEAEQTRVSFQLMLGVKPGNELLGWIDSVANRTQFTDGELKKFAQTLSFAGFKDENLKRAVLAVTDLAALSGGDAQGAVSALSKLMTSGIDTRSLRQLGLSEEAFLGNLSKNIGRSMEATKKLLAADKIAAETVFDSLQQSIADKTGNLIAGAGERMSGTMGARMKKLKDIIPNLFDELEGSRGFVGISNFMGKLAETFSPESPTGKRVIGALDGMLGRFSDALATVDFDLWAGRVLKAIEYFEAAINIGAKLGGIVVEVFRELAMVGEKIGDFAATMVMKGQELGTALWKGFKEGIVGGLTSVGESVGDMAFGAVSKVKSVLKMQSPSKVFEQQGRMTVAGFERGIELSQPRLEASVAAAFEVRPPALEGGAGAGAAGSNITISAPITVNVAGTTSTAQDIAEAVQLDVRRAFASFLEELALQGGQA